MKQVWILIVVFFVVVIGGLYMRPKPVVPEGFQSMGPSKAPATTMPPTMPPTMAPGSTVGIPSGPSSNIVSIENNIDILASSTEDIQFQVSVINAIKNAGGSIELNKLYHLVPDSVKQYYNSSTEMKRAFPTLDDFILSNMIDRLRGLLVVNISSESISDVTDKDIYRLMTIDEIREFYKRKGLTKCIANAYYNESKGLMEIEYVDGYKTTFDTIIPDAILKVVSFVNPSCPVPTTNTPIRKQEPIVMDGVKNNENLTTCITRAYYDAMGKITIEPQGIQFDQVADFIAYFTDLQKKNPSCLLPTIENYKGPIPGLLGGQGTGTISADQIALEDTNRSVWTTTEGGQPINSLDDYEYNRVFLENRDRNSQTSQQQKSQAIAQYQNDWTNLPYNSDTRASYEDQFVEARMGSGFRDPKTNMFFRNIDGSGVAPPDQDAMAIREAKILSDYQPTSLTTHIVDDETERVAKVVAQAYKDDPDWEPVIEKVAEHQYTVRELRPKARKTEWEGEEPLSMDDAQHQGLLSGSGTKPQMNIQRLEGDPYFAKDGVADYSNNRFWKYNEFDKWTPGLERMFAPTNETQQWS